jgi:hypothetical protein
VATRPIDGCHYSPELAHRQVINTSIYGDEEVFYLPKQAPAPDIGENSARRGTVPIAGKTKDHNKQL